MVTAMVLAMLASGHSLRHEPVSGSMVWEEPQPIQKMKMGKDKYLPMLRFNRESTYIFKTPKFCQQGKYTVQNGHYEFRAIMANDLENADIAKLKANMDPESAQKLSLNYIKSMANFTGDYDSANGVLTVYYPVEGMVTPFALHMYTEGDDQLTAIAADTSVVGLWHAPEPFPDRLDARTRYKIGGIEGLQDYANESQGSDGAQFGLLDLRVDSNYRQTDTVDMWSKNGSTVILIREKQKIYLTLSNDGQKLLSNGRVAFIRN